MLGVLAGFEASRKLRKRIKASSDMSAKKLSFVHPG